MPKRRAVYRCRGNYQGQPYTQVVRFPTEEAKRDRWIKAMPIGSSLTGRRELFVCASHFDCVWVISRGGRRPAAPSSVFSSIPKSCLKQSHSQPKKRVTLLISSTAWQQQEKERQMQDNSMNDFAAFLHQLPKRYTHISVKNDRDEVLSQLNSTASKVSQILWFRKIESPFGFLYLRVEKMAMK